MKRIRFYKKLLVEIVETLCTICLYLEQQGRREHIETSTYMKSHFVALKDFSDELRRKCK